MSHSVHQLPQKSCGDYFNLLHRGIINSKAGLICVLLWLTGMACRKNLALLRQKYYYATWKADGTRYMMLITREGVFLIDRNFRFRRVQLRFPVKVSPFLLFFRISVVTYDPVICNSTPSWISKLLFGECKID